MNKYVLFCFLIFGALTAQGQTTYYWVGGAPAAPQNISLAANWNTQPDGGGSPRGSSLPGTGGTDILVFDGTNYGGITPTTGIDSVNLNASFSCSQLKLVNGAKIIFVRTTAAGAGTTTATISGATGDDFVVEAGSSFTFTQQPTNGGSLRVAMLAGTTGRVSGSLTLNTSFQVRFDNTTGGTPGTFVFTAGSTFTTNITASSASYPFGTNSQSSEKWVVFEAGSTANYDGGFSLMGNNSTFQPVSFQAGSLFVMRASNPTSGFGTFFSRKAYANISILSGATLTADGTISAIDTLTINNGGNMVVSTTGQTVVLGDLIVAGSLTAPANSTNELYLGGTGLQHIRGAGTVTLSSLMVADGANVVLERSLNVTRAVTVNGRLDFDTYQLTGSASFRANAAMPAVTATGNRVSGAYLLTNVTGASGLSRGLSVSGDGLSSGTRVVSYTTNFDSVYISRPALTTGASGSLSFSSNAATLVTRNPAGFDPASGSVVVTDQKTYERVNYVVNAATAKPVGITDGNTAATALNLSLNAPVTTNASLVIYGSVQLTGKTTIRSTDTLRLATGAVLAGTYNSTNYFVTEVSGTTAGVLRRDDITGSTLFPVGTATNYLPVTLNPVSASDFAVHVFQGITTDGTPTGSPFTALQKQTVVDAVWTADRIAGTGEANLKLQWTPALEGTTFATFQNDEIGIIRNTGGVWSAPIGAGDNAANTADTLFSTFGVFSAGARPPKNPFLFNPLPAKTYGDADFSPGVISANTTSRITYTSSNPAVATIVGDNIHITGTGTTTIRAIQPTDGFYAAADVSQILTVSKAPLTIAADRKTKPQGDANPVLTATYTGFVRGEGPAVLSTPAVLTTTATTASAPGSYLISVAGATATNYTITFVTDSLIVRPRSVQTLTFPAFAAKTYGAADFGIGVTSTNPGIPIAYTSSNPAVATIVGSNIRIVGAGTTTITASQAGNDLFFSATPVAQTLTVAPAPLTVRVADTTRAYGTANPDFRLVYTGFVRGENSSVFTTQPALTTTAGINSAPGYYTVVPAGTVAANYTITPVAGRITIYPATGSDATNLQAFMSSGNTLSVRIFSPEPDLGDILLYNLKGDLVARKNVFIAPGYITATFAASGLPSGLYVVQVIGARTRLKLTIPLVHQ